jgi:hypothetical protein
VTRYRFVLDTTAVLAYDGSPTAIDVGELIAEASTEQRMIGVPSLCLTEAMRAATKPEQYTHLRLLLGLENVDLMPLDLPTLESCREFADWVDDLGARVDLAAAAYTATEWADDVYVVSSEPEAYGDLAPVIRIGGAP